MDITWLAYGMIEAVDGRFYSPLASARYRVIAPATALAAMGHTVRLLQVGPQTRIEKLEPRLAGDLVIVSKVMHPDRETFDYCASLTNEILRAARGQRRAIVVDMCDDHFEREPYGAFFRQLVSDADLVTASTPHMKEVVRRHSARPIKIVSDPCEGALGEVRFDPPRPAASGGFGRLLAHALPWLRRPSAVRLLWFGHPENLPGIAELAPQLAGLAPRYAFELHLVTAPNRGAEDLAAGFNQAHAPWGRMRFSPWSVETTWAALRECDLALLPVQASDETRLVKSPNRLIESLWAGRFAVASAIPSYQDLAAYGWVGDDLVEGIYWALEHPVAVRERISAAQAHINEHFAPAVIAGQWQDAFSAALTARSGRSGAASPPVRLNLGCGDKVLPGYINVDIAPNRGNVEPDVICDLRRLEPFAAESVDEVLSVHVVEHFWRWEVLEVLKDWVRVLKPGGKMILECPNLISACQELIANPEAGNGPGIEGQRTMWVLYGDPAWRDPLMVHRWGYTPRSLAQLMSEAGLVHIRQEPAQFKLREPRDMRMVGEKPGTGPTYRAGDASHGVV